MNDADLVEVTVTGPSEEWLVGFTRRLIADRVVACGQHARIRSCYRWRGQIEDEDEVRVALHTVARHVPAIIARTQTEHPYDVPCVLVTPVTASDSYAAWVQESTAG